MSIVLPFNKRQSLCEGDKAYYCVSTGHGRNHHWYSGSVVKVTKTQIHVKAGNGIRKFMINTGNEYGERRNNRLSRGFYSSACFLVTEEAYQKGIKDAIEAKALSDARQALTSSAKVLLQSENVQHLEAVNQVIMRLTAGHDPATVFKEQGEAFFRLMMKDANNV